MVVLDYKFTFVLSTGYSVWLYDAVSSSSCTRVRIIKARPSLFVLPIKILDPNDGSTVPIGRRNEPIALRIHHCGLISRLISLFCSPFFVENSLFSLPPFLSGNEIRIRLGPLTRNSGSIKKMESSRVSSNTCYFKCIGYDFNLNI